MGTENGSSTSASQTSPQKPPSFVAAIEGVEAAIRDLIREESEEERQRVAEIAKKDLAAQTEMAEWAREMAVASMAAAAFTFFGLILIWRTLGHTRTAAEHTQDMLDQTKETTSLTRDMFVESEKATAAARKSAEISEMQYRRDFAPYVAIVGGKYLFGADVWKVNLDIMNIGKSLANTVFVSGAIQVIQGKVEEEFLVSGASVIQELSGRSEIVQFNGHATDVIPGETRSAPFQASVSLHVSDRAREIVSQDERTVFIHCSISWQTAVPNGPKSFAILSEHGDRFNVSGFLEQDLKVAHRESREES